MVRQIQDKANRAKYQFVELSNLTNFVYAWKISAADLTKATQMLEHISDMPKYKRKMILNLAQDGRI